MRIREVATASGKHALQVVSKRLGVLKVHKHIGTYQNETEKALLHQKAQDYIKKHTGQISLNDYLTSAALADIIITKSRPLFAYELLSRCYDKLGFVKYPDPIIKDLVIARLYHPASKRELQEYICESLDRHYSLRTIYRHMKQSFKTGIKERFQEALITFARQSLGDTLQLVFYS